MHLTILALTGVVMGALTAFVGLPGMTEFAAWMGAYVIWVAYGMRFKLQTPVRTMMVASTLSGLLTGSIQVVYMDEYRASNPWYAEYFSGESQNLAIQFLGQGIVLGLVFGLIVGLITRTLIRRRAA